MSSLRHSTVEQCATMSARDRAVCPCLLGGGAGSKEIVLGRPKFAEAFYSSGAWQTCRTSYAKSKAWTCERCGGAGAQVHHKIRLTPANLSNPEIALNWHNLELLCDECHKAEHKKREKKKPKRYAVAEDGRLLIR